MEEHFVEEMNNALVTNADVVVGKKLIKNWETGNKAHRTLYANLSALTYTSVDTLGNKYKSDHGEALAMCGQGMMLSQKFLEKYQGFPFKSLCEDVEVGIHAMLYDFKELYMDMDSFYTCRTKTVMVIISCNCGILSSISLQNIRITYCDPSN